MRQGPRSSELACLCIAALLLGGCNRTPSAAPTVPSTVGAPNGTAHQAAPRVDQSDAKPTATRSFTALIQELPLPQQRRVLQWYERIGVPTMENVTAEQVAWMEQRGYPMPAEIARAEVKSDAELKAEADTGDAIARTLYVDRLLDEYGRRTDARGSGDGLPLRLIDGIGQAMPQILATGSPFAGYLYAAQARTMSAGDPNAVAAGQLAGLVWANQFGDSRAAILMKTPTIQAVDPWTAAVVMNSMLSDAIRENPMLLETAPVPIPAASH